MHFDFIDIGTCDFETSAQIANVNQSVLLVEPIQFYLDRIHKGPNITKANLAVGNTKGFIDVKYVPESVIVKYNLPHWIKGCSNVGEGYHKTVHRVFVDNNIPLSLIELKQVECVTFDDLCKRYTVESINFLKIDTEGYEQYILPGVLDMIKNGFRIDNLKYENQESLGNKAFVDLLTIEFVKLGYQIIDINQTDTTLKKI